MRAARFVAVVALTALITSEVIAGQDPNLARGVASGNSYRALDIDTINQFNGNLVLRIDLSSLPVGPSLTQSLVLTYNSKVYDYQFVEHRNNATDTLYKRRAIPESASNAGLGWILSLGRLVPPRAGTPTTPERGWFYRGPDGAEHDFTLDVGDPAEAFTHDGSFLRFRRYPSNTSLAVTHRTIEFPDGTVQQFNPNGDLTQITDLYGHWIKVDYSDAMKWVITNGHDDKTFRTTTVNFQNRPAPAGYTYEPNFQKVVSSIVVPAFGGTTAQYDFTYVDQVLPRDGCGDWIDTDPTHFAAPLLTEIGLPGNTKYVATYRTTLYDACTAGLIVAMQLPTLGSIEWTHQEYRLSQAACDDEHGWVVGSPGVATRTLKDAAGSVLGQWSYTPSIDLNPGAYVACGPFDGWNFPYGPAPTEATTTVTEKEGSSLTTIRKTTHYFSAVLNQNRANALGYKTEEYGLPFTRRVAHASNLNRFLSVERHDAANTLLRSSYLTYKGDAQNFDEKLSNPRIQGELAVFNADTGCGAVCRVDVDRPETDYDGYGKYRKSVTSSNFGSTRTSFTNYTPNASTWILGTYDQTWIEENGAAAKRLFSFDAKGALEWRRVLVNEGATAGAIGIDLKKDLLEVFCRDTRGFLTAEKFFGGDGDHPIPTSGLCAATPAQTEYQVDHLYTYDETSHAPIKHTAQYSGTTFFITDTDLDLNTGAISTSRDVSAIATTYTYDALGRPTEIRPTGLPWTLFEYTDAAGATPASVRVTTRPWGTTSFVSPLTDAYVYYDSFGRSVQEKTRIPSDTGSRWSTSSSTYDVLGRRTQISVPEFRDTSSYESTFAPAKWTTAAYDIFGRATSVLGPDGKTRLTSYTGSGIREVARIAEIGFPTGAAYATTQETRDAHGRLLWITEANGTKTNYTYDHAGRLTKVCQNTIDEGVTCGQTRLFDYDNRGFLESESHPESGTATFTYDARGHALSKSIAGAPNSQANLQFTWDTAERLTGVLTRNPNGSGYRSGKSFMFGSANSGTGDANKKLGKPTSATRYNYDAGTVVVKESFDYEDYAGRLTKTTTEITRDGTLLQTLEQGQGYSVSGNLGSLTYPTCITVACGSANWNTLSFGHTDGLLTTVSGFANSIGYAASGSVSKVQHTGTVTDTYTPDDTGARPKSIQFQGYTSCSGPSIAAGSPADQSVAPGQSATLTVSATGATGYQWYLGNGTAIVGATGTSYTTPSVSATATYYVEAYNNCRIVQSRVVTVTPLTLTAPTGLVATGGGHSWTAVTWNASVNAHHYVLERKANGASFATILTTTATSVQDVNVTANITYVYRVRAASADGLVTSDPSNADIATTVVFAPIVAGQTPINASLFHELLGAVNMVRAASGTAAATWASILPAGVPPLAAGEPLRAQYIHSLRSAMDAARVALGSPPLTYEYPTVTGRSIQVSFMTEIRGGVE